MPYIRNATSVGANATIANDIQGSQFEFIGGGGAYVRFFAVQLSGSVGDIQATLSLTSDVILQGGAINVRAAGLQVKDDEVATGVALPGDRLVLRLVNTTAGAIVVNYMIEIQAA